MPVRLLGIGGNGVVVGAVRLSDGHPVAIKIIYKDLKRAAFESCLPNEIVLLRSLKSWQADGMTLGVGHDQQDPSSHGSAHGTVDSDLARACRHSRFVSHLMDFEDGFYYYLVTSLCEPAWTASQTASKPCYDAFDSDSDGDGDDSNTLALPAMRSQPLPGTVLPPSPSPSTSPSPLKTDPPTDTAPVATASDTTHTIATKPSTTPTSVSDLALSSSPNRRAVRSLLRPPQTAHTPTSATHGHLQQQPLMLECFLPSGRPVLVAYAASASSDLYTLLESNRDVLPDTIICSLFAQLVASVALLHAHGWIHGDLKEENVLVDQCLNAVLCDFGHARPCGADPTASLSPTPNGVANADGARCVGVVSAGTTAMTPPELLANLARKREICKQTERQQQQQQQQQQQPIKGDDHQPIGYPAEGGCAKDAGLTRVDGFKVDVWALGMMLFTISHRRFPACHEAMISGKVDIASASVLPCDFDESGLAANPLLRDLVSKMLAIDPETRISACDVLRHPFVRDALAL
ncbi:kinase-like domain-containing protein [Entophlyctis helioformis]|nr:kinase-like domain-containing protein [Entophlyctis helioformis]